MRLRDVDVERTGGSPEKARRSSPRRSPDAINPVELIRVYLRGPALFVRVSIRGKSRGTTANSSSVRLARILDMERKGHSVLNY